MSLAITWANPDFRVSAMTADGSAFGIVQAHLGSGANRPERYLLEMRGVPFRSTLEPGTLVVSSGYGGVYPEGVPVGTILGEIKTSETWARTYLVRPSVSPPQISSVMILQPPRAKAGVRNVWASAAAADSAARRVVAAGDSIARSNARAELAARRAALDSARVLMGDSTTAPATPVAPAPSPAVPPILRPATPRRATPPVTPPATPPADSAVRRPAPRPDSAQPRSVPPDTVRPSAGTGATR